MKILPLAQEKSVGSFYSFLFECLAKEKNFRSECKTVFKLFSETHPSVPENVFKHVLLHRLESRPDMLRAVVSSAYKDMAFSPDQSVGLMGCMILNKLHALLAPKWSHFVWIHILDYDLLTESVPTSACSKMLYMESSTPGILSEFWKNPAGFDVLLHNPENYMEGFWIRKR